MPKESVETEVKKDKEWAKEEVYKMMPSHGEMYNHPDDITVLKTEMLNSVIDLLDQLDEPETDQHSYKKGFLDGQKDQRQHFEHISKNQDTLSQKWIDEHKYFAEEKIGEDAVVKARDLRNLLVPKQELPVIPKFVADFIEEVKPDNSLRVSFEYIAQRKRDNHDDELAFWVEEGNSETFARAWLDGYTVEEQKYLVEDNRYTLLCKYDGKVISTRESEEDELPMDCLSFELTEQEIKGYDERYWPFAVKAEELEE